MYGIVAVAAADALGLIQDPEPHKTVKYQNGNETIQLRRAAVHDIQLKSAVDEDTNATGVSSRGAVSAGRSRGAARGASSANTGSTHVNADVLIQQVLDSLDNCDRKTLSGTVEHMVVDLLPSSVPSESRTLAVARVLVGYLRFTLSLSLVLAHRRGVDARGI